MKRSNPIGVDISDSSIKVLQLDAEGGIVAYGTAVLPPGVVVGGRIVSKEFFAKTLENILRNTRPQMLYAPNESLRAVLSLPESKLFTHYLVIPDSVKKAELESFIRDDAEKIIPFDLDMLYSDYHVAEEDGRRNATFVGVPKAELDNYVEAFTYAKVKPAFVGGELFALGNALLPAGTLHEDYMIVDMGAHATTIGIFSVDAIANASIKILRGGEYLSRTLSEKHGISIEDAENKKCQFGVNPEFEHTGVPAVLRECVLEIIGRIKEAKEFFEKKTGNPIKHLVLAGGSALLPSIAPFIEAQIGIETRIADPLKKIKNHEVLEKDTPGILFADVIGLALYGLSTERPRINLLTKYRYEEGETEKELLTIRDIRSLSDFYYVVYSLFQKSRELLSVIVRPLRIIKKVRAQLLLTVIFLFVAIGFFTWVLLTYL